MPEVVPINQIEADAQDVLSPGVNVLAPYPEVSDVLISRDDENFLLALRHLKKLAAFLLQVPVVSSKDVQSAARLGGLNQLRPALRTQGRAASYQEWAAVETRTQVIWGSLPDTYRRKFLATQTPGWISYLLSAFIAIAMTSLVIAYLIQVDVIGNMVGGILIPFLLWIVSLGAIGAAASIGMNALSVQDDATFDVSSGKLIWLRLLLGALFGTVLTLPLGFGTFNEFLTGLSKAAGGHALAQTNVADVTRQASLLLLPFILGFSTSLVILVLNRFIESAQTFFGKTSGEKRSSVAA